MRCHYCAGEVRLFTGEDLFSNPDFKDNYYYVCYYCEARVGCHPGTKTPLGSLANAELRYMRQEVHSMFDELWKGGSMTRREAYAWLSKKMKLREWECHIGKFDERMCKRAMIALKSVSTTHI